MNYYHNDLKGIAADMEQLSLFAEAGQSRGLPEELLEYHPGLIDEVTGNG